MVPRKNWALAERGSAAAASLALASAASSFFSSMRNLALTSSAGAHFGLRTRTSSIVLWASAVLPWVY